MNAALQTVTTNANNLFAKVNGTHALPTAVETEVKHHIASCLLFAEKASGPNGDTYQNMAVNAWNKAIRLYKANKR